MRKFAYNKLVRDKILASMLEMGEKVDHKILSDEEYLQALKDKILEEASEIELGDSQKAIKEIADLQEILDSIVTALGKTKEDVAALQQKKNEKAGGFEQKIFITTTELEDDNEWVKYLESNPGRYPEIK